MQLGVIGLGRMGADIARRLVRDGHTCVVYGARLRSRGMRSKSTARRAAWSKNWVTREVSDSRWARVSVPR